ncbi:Plasma membrane sulfite pump involved in sulfite metabolism [Coemansia aciculifera]|uniref:Plasma membrane sulfite pump involved in sulfite metabolism n=1 Tax=Coemansia aciculifera TaxID=417176 RepID=A0A9W8IK79_9FUNG|nr:Plasma membrane sulfite pump involved in sulfite metabolism [Coemansia aciculifera]
MRRLVKRLQRLLAMAVAGLESVSVRWLAVVTALNIYAQLWRTYASVADLDPDNSNNTPYPRSVGGDCLIAIVAAMSYTGLALQLLLLPILAAQVALAVARQPQAPFQLKQAIKSVSLLLVSVFATIANHSGIIDITSAPLVADIFLVVWKVCALASAVCAFLVLPAYVAATMRQSRRQRRRPASRPETALEYYSESDPDLVDPYPWFLLLLPAITASSCAGDLTMVLQPRDASDVLIYSFVLWGAAIAPALVFTISYIRHQVSRYSQLPPGSTTSPLDVIFPSAPVSQLALAIMSLGIQSRRVWADTVGPSTAPLLLGELAMAAGAILGLVLWASSAAWLINAHVLVIHKYRRWLRRSREEQNGVSLIIPPTADTTLLLVPRQTRSAVAGCWKQVNSLAACHAVYSLASFALATAYIARIWDSSIALHLAQLSLAYVTVLMAVALVRALYAAAQWIAAVATYYLGCRHSARSTLLQSPLSHAIVGDGVGVFDCSRSGVIIDSRPSDAVVVRGSTYGSV